MDACEEVAAALETKICKNLFLCNRQKTSFYLLLMPGDKPFHTKEITSSWDAHGCPSPRRRRWNSYCI